MKDYLLLFRGGLDFATASPEQLQSSMLKWQEWIEKMKNDGRWGGGSRLQPTGKVIKPGDMNVVDGPFAEAKEVIGGYVVLKAEDMDDAIAISKTCPIFLFNGFTEVREIAVMN